ncbi:MAG: IS5 family transposase [Oxalobacteraceae bacterium]|nr:MAG: IS5 family transposase [Oxalobacteraceae bacterium]
MFRALQVTVNKDFCAIDGSYVRAHQHSSGGAEESKKNGIGLSRGGRTTKLHARVSGQGRPLQVEVSPGSVHDAALVPVLLEKLDAAAVLGDKAYGSDAIIHRIEQAGALPVIPARINRRTPRYLIRSLYKERNLVERFFNYLKYYLGFATRYEKTAGSFLAMAHLACARMWVHLSLYRSRSTKTSVRSTALTSARTNTVRVHAVAQKKQHWT